MKRFTITEEDIDARILYARHEEGIELTREEAREKLEEMLAGIHSLSHSDPEKLLAMQEQFNKFKKR